MLLAMSEALKDSRARKGSQQNNFPKILGNQRNTYTVHICFLGVPVAISCHISNKWLWSQSPKQLITSPVTMMITSLNQINNLSQVQDYPAEI